MIFVSDQIKVGGDGTNVVSVVGGVVSSGTFIKDASMTGWTTCNNGIPSNWTVQDA